jgi:4-amino-4-deoxy-L-arabinose transferase-like glycosyltransferase
MTRPIEILWCKEGRLLNETHESAFRARRLLLVAAIWHIAFVLTIFFIGRTQVLPPTFDRNGIGISFAIDSHSYRIEAEEMARLIERGQFRQWINYNASFHVKLYSLSFAFAGRLAGFNILAAEPLNLLYYLSILALVYCVAREAFDRQVAGLATAVVGVWPSLLLHTTQLLRDSLFIPSMLLLALALLLAVSRTLSLKAGVLLAIQGAIASLLLWLCRGDMWEMVLMILLLGGAISILAQLKARRLSLGNVVAVTAMIMVTLFLPKLVSTHRQPNRILSASPAAAAGELQGNVSAQEEKKIITADKPQTPFSALAMRVGLLRHKFIVRYPLAGSNIDTNVELRGVGDIIRYLPRAALIGFCSPFPNMWISRGAQVGLEGRLIAGIEMFFMYLILGLAGLTLLRQRRRLVVWLLFGISSIGCIALGYVVVNISTLYRMRYAYFILVIILAMEAVVCLLPARRSRKLSSCSPSDQESAAQP